MSSFFYDTPEDEVRKKRGAILALLLVLLGLLMLFYMLMPAQAPGEPTVVAGLSPTPVASATPGAGAGEGTPGVGAGEGTPGMTAPGAGAGEGTPGAGAGEGTPGAGAGEGTPAATVATPEHLPVVGGERGDLLLWAGLWLILLFAGLRVFLRLKFDV
jgi:hypothetical protein